MRAWRVEYHQNIGHVFEPRGRLQADMDINQLRARHLAWEWGFASPFLSVFTDKALALAWANERHSRCVYEINTDGLEYIPGRDNELLIIGPIPLNNRIPRELDEQRDDLLRRAEARARAEAYAKAQAQAYTQAKYEQLHRSDMVGR